MRFYSRIHSQKVPGLDAGSLSNTLEFSLRVLMEIVQKRLLLTRLETRTKESTPYASLRVEKPEGVTKVSIRCEPVEGQHQPTLILE